MNSVTKFAVPIKVARDDLRGTGSSDESRTGADSRDSPRLESSAAGVTVTAADAVGITGCPSLAEKELRKDNLKKASCAPRRPLASH